MSSPASIREWWIEGQAAGYAEDGETWRGRAASPDHLPNHLRTRKVSPRMTTAADHEPSIEDVMSPVHCADAATIRRRLAGMSNPASDFFASYLADEFGGWDLMALVVVTGFVEQCIAYERQLDGTPMSAVLTFRIMRPTLIAQVAEDVERDGATLARALAFTLAQG